MTELSDDIYLEIQTLCETGDKLSENGNFATALENYWKAYDLIPEPKNDWDATLWVLTAIGDVNFLGEDFQAGADNLRVAMHCPGAIGNPFVHLRLGQCLFEIGDLDKAAEELTRAYAIEGEKIFLSENSKYFQFLKTRIIVEKKKTWWKFGK